MYMGTCVCSCTCPSASGEQRNTTVICHVDFVFCLIVIVDFLKDLLIFSLKIVVGVRVHAHTRALACTLTCYVQGTVMCVRVCTHDYKCLQSKERVLAPLEPES